jgi:hypothetical protein
VQGELCKDTGVGSVVVNGASVEIHGQAPLISEPLFTVRSGHIWGTGELTFQSREGRDQPWSAGNDLR